jgi:hypothetical protein
LATKSHVTLCIHEGFIGFDIALNTSNNTTLKEWNMRNLFSMALLMLSFPSIGSELKTLTTYVEYGKELSPSFYEDVMSNIQTIQKTCESAPQRKAELIAQLKAQPLTAKDYSLKKEQIEMQPMAISNSLASQISKIEGAQENLISTPSCLADDIGVNFMAFAKLSGLDSIDDQFKTATNYLDDIRMRVNEISWAKGFSKGEVTQKEKDVYAYCSTQLKKLMEEVNYEK